jgi:uncharacterized protein with HEPN domain
MYDETLVLDILHQVIDAIETVEFRFEPISCVDDFTNSPVGMEKLDSICMLLIAIGESIKNVDKITIRTLLQQYSEVDWKGVKGMRDIISHHYFDIDAEEIYFVCDTKLSTLKTTIQEVAQSLKGTSKDSLE